MTGVGVPVATGVKLPAVPLVKLVLAAEVMSGGMPTVSVKSWVALGVKPLAAVKVIGKVPVWVGVPVSSVPL